MITPATRSTGPLTSDTTRTPAAVTNSSRGRETVPQTNSSMPIAARRCARVASFGVPSGTTCRVTSRPSRTSITSRFEATSKTGDTHPRQTGMPNRMDCSPLTF